jgi:TolB-like protein/class 3 adenylate cyclase
MSSPRTQMKSKGKLAAIMFTDIVGYTALVGNDSSKALELVHINSDIQKPLVEKHHGKWLKEMGDGAMVQFNTALDAVNCAVEIQKSARSDLDAKLRIGIHSGDITIENDDIFGDGVNVATRLESIADPGGIYISESIEKAIRGKSDVQAKYLGEVRLKNVTYGIRTYVVQGVGLPVPEIKEDQQLKGHFWAEVQRRGLLRTGATYLVLSLLAVMLLPHAESIGSLPQWAPTGLMGILIVGFPIAMYLAWNYERSPEGFVRTTSQQSWQNPYKGSRRKPLTSNVIIAGMALILVGVYLYTRFLSGDQDQQFLVTDKFSIAVLPFDNMSPDKENEWFSDAVTEDILTHLMNITDLLVISRTSVKQYKDSDKTIPEMAKELGVFYIVAGSVRKLNDEVLITARLIDATDKQIWADTYEEKSTGAFEIQQKVSTEIVQALKIILSPEEEKSLNTSATANLEALQLFLKGRDLAESRTEEGLAESIKYYQKAIELDPDYADAYAQIANSTHLQVNARYISVEVGEDLIEKYVAKALILNPNTAEAYTTLGNENRRKLNFEKALENYLRAIKINPSHASAHSHLSWLYKYNFEDEKSALKHIREALRLDPLSPMYLNACIRQLLNNHQIEDAMQLFQDMGFILDIRRRTGLLADITALLKRDWTEAIIVFENAIRDNPNNAVLHSMFGWLNWQIHNDADKLLKHTKIAYDIDPSSYFSALLLHKDYKEAKALLSNPDFLKSVEKDEIRLRGFYHYQSDDFEMALEYFNSHEDAFGYVTIGSWHIAYKAFALAALGETDEALKLMNKYRFDIPKKAAVFAVLEVRDSMYQYLNSIRTEKGLALYANGFPEFDLYRDEPAFKEFQERNYLPVKE